MEKKLLQIFMKVFDLSESEVNSSLNRESLVKWDSLAQMDLITVVEKEFQTQFDIQEIVEMNSFESIVLALMKKKGNTVEN